jgi:glycosyltransferase involved in cell wall biosynthesis
MRIAQIATCSGPVREDNTGSVESLVWLLSRELTAMGHDVTVFGCAGSDVPCAFVETQPGPYGTEGAVGDWQLSEWINLSRAVEQSHRFDVMHSHVYVWGLPLEPLSRAPMVHTMHTCPYEDEALVWDGYPDARVTALSAFQWRDATPRRPFAIIPHGFDPARFTFRERPDDYLCYLGRFIPGKGPLEAVAAARELNMPLVLAGPSSEYFESQVRPHVDGQRVRYAGWVDRCRRDALLGGARALLYPLREPEPFGLVQVEAMMCGTPVAAIGVGAVPEVVEEGVTGCIAPTTAELVGAAARALTLSRARIRSRAAARFTARVMAEHYQRAYKDACRTAARPDLA